MGRAEVKTTGLDTNDCWSIEIMHWKSRDERKWRSSPIGLVLYMGTESEKKSQMRKCGMIWADLPLTSKGGGRWLGTRVMPGDQSWVTRASREDSPDWVSCKLLEQAGRPPAGTDDSRGTRDWVSSNWAPVVWVPSSPRNQGGRVMGHNFSYYQVVQCLSCPTFY